MSKNKVHFSNMHLDTRFYNKVLVFVLNVDSKSNPIEPTIIKLKNGKVAIHKKVLFTIVCNVQLQIGGVISGNLHNEDLRM